MESTDHTKCMLGDDLDDCVRIATELDGQISGTSSKEYQERVKKTIERLENITRQVSTLDMFSENENFDELPSSNLRFLMLPALLAILNDKLTNIERRSNLENVEIYIRDFIKRLKNYGILPAASNQFCVDPVNVAAGVDEKKRSDDNNKPTSSNQMSTTEYLSVAIKNREEKMKLYREQQEYKEQYEELSKKFSNKVDDDEFLRQFFTAEMNYWARKLYELYINIQREKPLLEHMAKIESGEIKPELQQKKIPPPKPIILTRCKLQKDVYGLGYPSVATMTVDEFYEQKIKEGQLQDSNANHQGPITEEDENIAKEEAREKDEDSLVQSEREFDEYKDDHRRGWGNTYNKG